MLSSYRLRSFQVGRLSRVSRRQPEWKTTRSVQTHRPKSTHKMSIAEYGLSKHPIMSRVTSGQGCWVTCLGGWHVGGDLEQQISLPVHPANKHRGDSLNPSTAAGTALGFVSMAHKPGGLEAPTWSGGGPLWHHRVPQVPRWMDWENHQENRSVWLS